jgi:uncharacterized RDD family membrane protein YckC
MPRRLLILLVLCTLGTAGAASSEQTPQHIDSIVTHGTGQGQFLAVVERVHKSDGTYLPVSVVWYRPMGGGPEAWKEYAKFDARVLALAERGGDLAVLLEIAESGPGRTQLRYVHNSLEPASRAVDIGGSALPAGVTALDIAGGAGGGPLLALGVLDGQTGVWALAGSQWHQLAPLPEALAKLDPAALDLASVGRRAILAARVERGTVTIFEQAQDGWLTRATVELADDEYDFLAINSTVDAPPMLYLFGEADRIVQLDSSSASADGESPTRSSTVAFDAPADTAVSWAADDPRAAAVALGSLRLLRAAASAGDGESDQTVLLELALDPSTLEPIGGGAVALTFSSITAELREQMITLVLYALLVVAVVAVLRQRPLPPADRLRAVSQQLAPLHIRFLAGTIDGLPLLVAALAWWLAGDRIGGAGQGILGIGALLVYFGHTTASEAATGRTIGKKIFDLRVVRTDGAEAGPGAILLRNILRPLDLPTAGLGLAWLNPLRQRLGDIAAGTIVIRQRRQAKAPSPPGTA